MTHLIVTDLAKDKALDRPAMRAIRDSSCNGVTTVPAKGIDRRP